MEEKAARADGRVAAEGREEDRVVVVAQAGCGAAEGEEDEGEVCERVYYLGRVGGCVVVLLRGVRGLARVSVARMAVVFLGSFLLCFMSRNDNVCGCSRNGGHYIGHNETKLLTHLFTPVDRARHGLPVAFSWLRGVVRHCGQP